MALPRFLHAARNLGAELRARRELAQSNLINQVPVGTYTCSPIRSATLIRAPNAPLSLLQAVSGPCGGNVAQLNALVGSDDANLINQGNFEIGTNFEIGAMMTAVGLMSCFVLDATSQLSNDAAAIQSGRVRCACRFGRCGWVLVPAGGGSVGQINALAGDEDGGSNLINQVR